MPRVKAKGTASLRLLVLPSLLLTLIWLPGRYMYELEDEYETSFVKTLAEGFKQAEGVRAASAPAPAPAPSPRPQPRSLLRGRLRRRRHRHAAIGLSTRSIVKHAATLAAEDMGLLPEGSSATLNDMQVGCPWSATVTAGTYNIAFPDLNCIYQVMVFRLRPNKVVRITGRFPDVRYFSYQTYSLPSGQPLTSIIDYQIIPTQGINPFRRGPHYHHYNGSSSSSIVDTPSSVWDRTGTYQIHVTSSGQEGMINELAAAAPPPQDGGADDAGCSGSGAGGSNGACGLGLVIFRIYTADPENNAFHHSSRNSTSPSGKKSDPRLWGYVPPPIASVAFKSSVHDVRPTFWKIPDCDEHTKSLTEAVLDYKVSTLKGEWQPSAQDNEVDNFLVYTRDTAGSRALFANADANYLFATAQNNRTDEGLELVARIRARLPKVAHGMDEPPYVGEALTYDARYASFSTIAMEGAAPVVDTLLDVTIEKKYGWGQQEHGHSGAHDAGYGLGSTKKHKRRGKGPADRWNRYFSVVTGPSSDLLERCPPSIYSPARDLFLQSRTRQGTVPRYQGFLYRQILSRWQMLPTLLETGDRSVAWAKHVCTSMGHGYCRRKEVFLQAMRSYYPRIEYYYCGYNATGGCDCFHSNDGKAVPYHDNDGGQGEGQAWGLMEGPEDDDQGKEHDVTMVGPTVPPSSAPSSSSSSPPPSQEALTETTVAASSMASSLPATPVDTTNVSSGSTTTTITTSDAPTTEEEAGARGGTKHKVIGEGDQELSPPPPAAPLQEVEEQQQPREEEGSTAAAAAVTTGTEPSAEMHASTPSP